MCKVQMSGSNMNVTDMLHCVNHIVIAPFCSRRDIHLDRYFQIFLLCTVYHILLEFFLHCSIIFSLLPSVPNLPLLMVISRNRVYLSHSRPVPTSCGICIPTLFQSTYLHSAHRNELKKLILQYAH